MSWKRKQDEKHRLKKLTNECGHAWFNPEKKRYVRFWLGTKGKHSGIAFWKRQMRRKIRRDSEIFQQHGKHRIFFDKWSFY